MRLGGILDISTKDIPGRPSMVFFTVGCNFKCGFCHNKYLLHPNVGRDYEINYLINQINSNLLVSGISITGGEPTLQDDLIDLCKAIKQKTSKYLSVDTNGYKPEMIQKIISYIDRVALDLKGPLNPKKYEKITKTYVDIAKIIQTINFLKQRNNIDFEVRTTYVENLLEPTDLKEIIDFLNDISFKGNFVLQQYQFREGVGEKFKEIFSKPQHKFLLNLLKPYKSLDLGFNLFLRDEMVGYINIKKL
ncbi:MAG: anaerobic ribonucleoside-triphosphate reductase activating protein [Promethearchaeota archaeon]